MVSGTRFCLNLLKASFPHQILSVLFLCLFKILYPESVQISLCLNSTWLNLFFTLDLLNLYEFLTFGFLYNTLSLSWTSPDPCFFQIPSSLVTPEPFLLNFFRCLSHDIVKNPLSGILFLIWANFSSPLLFVNPLFWMFPEFSLLNLWIALFS